MGTDTRRGHHQRCGWVLRRLPLLAGDELTGAERRHVEQHLLTCTDCRVRKASLGSALEALRASAAVGIGEEAEGSLWPALARQIREEKHAPRSTLLSDWIAWIDARLLPASHARRLAFGLALLASLGAVGWAHRFARQAEDQLADARRPVAGPRRPEPLPLPPSSDREVLSRNEPTGSLSNPGTLEPLGAVSATSAARYSYDLDHGTPMDPDVPDAKATY